MYVIMESVSVLKRLFRSQLLKVKGNFPCRWLLFAYKCIKCCSMHDLCFQQTKQSLIQALVKQNSNTRARVEKQKHEVHTYIVSLVVTV